MRRTLSGVSSNRKNSTGPEAQRLTVGEDTLEQGARADAGGAVTGKVGDEQRTLVILQRQGAAAGGVDAGPGVGESGAPARKRVLAVEFVGGVPAEDHVAEAEALVQRAEELVAADILAAQHPVEIADRQFDVLDTRFPDEISSGIRVGDGVRVHKRVPAVGLRSATCREVACPMPAHGIRRPVPCVATLCPDNAYRYHRQMLDTRPLLLETDFPPIRRQRIDTLQVNLGYRCNLSCVHCHVNAGPTRTEEMTADTASLIVEAMDRLSPAALDLTGGAPELNANFRRLVFEARERGIEVIDRCNLTILLEPGQQELAQFLADQGVTITASLPCYLEENVEQQRGKGVYDDSIRAIRLLNELGYGREPGLALNLVYNPVGPVLPPPQAGLLRRRAAVPGAVPRLHASVEGQLQQRKSRYSHVSQPGERRLAGLSLRLRFQSDAGYSADGERQAAPHSRPAGG